MSSPLIDDQQINIRKLFPSPVASIRHPEADRLNAALTSTILAREQQRPSVSHSNEGGWQSSDDFAAWAGPEGLELVAFAQELARRLTAVHSPEHGLVHAEFEWKYNAWANINRAGNSNALHGHAGSFWSAVYWVDDGGRTENPEVGGDLEFIDPRGLIASMYNPALRMRIEECVAAGHATAIPACSGTLTMFPSWLAHAVKPFMGARPRVSVAFNFGT